MIFFFVIIGEKCRLDSHGVAEDLDYYCSQRFRARIKPKGPIQSSAPTSAVLSMGGRSVCWSKSRESHQDDSRVEHLSYKERPRKLGFFILEKRKL